MNKNVRTALVIPVRNESDSIKILLDSIDRQTATPSEVMFVDGGSADATKEILGEYCKTHENSRLLKLKDTFPGENRNTGVRASNAEIIAFTDAGMELDSQWFQEIIRPFMNNNSIDVVYGDYYPATDTWFRQCSSIAYISLPDLVINGKRMRHHSVASMAIKRKVWEAVGGFPPLRSGEDLIFMDRIKALGFKEAFAPNAQVKWYIQDTFKAIFKRSRLYAKWGIVAGKTHQWHWNIFLYYLSAFLGGYLWFSAVHSPIVFIFSIIIMNVIRSLKCIIKNRYYNWVWFLRLDRIIGVVMVISLIDFATLLGFYDWVIDRKMRRAVIAS